MLKNNVKFFILVSLPLLLMACSALKPHHPLTLEGSSQSVRPGDIIETATGAVIPFERLIEKLSSVRVVYVGETHTSLPDHRIQLEILKALSAQNPSLVLALEMLPREVQPVLDEYAQGKMTEELFLAKADWERNWGHPFLFYRGIFNLAKENRLRIIGLNAPIEVVNRIAQAGLASLTPEERTRVAQDFHPADPEHKAYIEGQFNQHPPGKIKGFETFYEAQLAWEETMAETLAQALEAGPEESQILVLIGKGHILYKLGLPRLTRIRSNQSYKTILPVPDDFPVRNLDPKMADTLWITERSENPHRPRLGVSLRPHASGEGLEIISVVPGSAAEKAGLKAEDILLKIDEVALSTLEDLPRIFSQRKGSYVFLIKRGGRVFSEKISLTP